MKRPLLIAAACTALLTPLGLQPARAQVIEVPPFALGANASSTPDVAVGVDGTMTFVWASVSSQTTVARQFSPSGLPVGTAQRVDASGKVREATISAAPQGGYFVAWHRRPVNQRSAQFSRRLDANGVPLGSEVEVSTGNPIYPEVPTLAALPTGAVLVWRDLDFVGRQIDTAGNPHTSFPIGTGADGGGLSRDAAALPDGAFIAAWRTFDDGGRLRIFEASGLPRTDALPIGDFAPRGVAVNPIGTLVVVSTGGDFSGLWLQRFTHAGTAVGAPVLVEPASPTEGLFPAVGIDRLDNVYVAWTRYDIDLGAVGSVRARVYDANDQPLGPAIDVGDPAAVGTNVAALPHGRFVTTWRSNPTGISMAAVVSVCTPGTSVCGDGTQHPQCEACDDGAGNSDSTPDACRTDCQPARCGDGTVDSGEECDDGNNAVCDGCTPFCTLEPGIVCGDGVRQPNCGEQCDDANGISGDGCTPSCDLERVPGGGTPRTECYTEWSVDNPSNVPLLDKHGAFNAKQRCVDDDPQCDHDGGVPGSCTFHLHVCANNVEPGTCSPPNRLANWSLEKPSEKQAALRPALAAARDALAVVPGTIVGPSAADVCTPTIAVTVPLRAAAVGYHAGKLALKTRAGSYDDTSDVDKLLLTCVPGS